MLWRPLMNRDIMLSLLLLLLLLLLRLDEGKELNLHVRVEGGECFRQVGASLMRLVEVWGSSGGGGRLSLVLLGIENPELCEKTGIETGVVDGRHGSL
jgi:hypothetical protein